MSTLEQRMEKLEKRLRFYQIAFISILLAGGFLVISGFNKKNQVPDLIQAKGFQVVDDQGRVLVSLRNTDNAGNINLYDATGSDFINLLSSVDGTGIIVTKNRKGNIACRLTHYNDDAGNDDGSGRVEVFNKDGKMVSEVGSNSNGSGYFAAMNNQEKKVVTISPTDQGTGAVSVYNDQGTEALNMSVASTNDGIVSVYNHLNNRICVLGPDNNSNGVLNVLNSAGQNMNGVWPKQ